MVFISKQPWLTCSVSPFLRAEIEAKRCLSSAVLFIRQTKHQGELYESGRGNTANLIPSLSAWLLINTIEYLSVQSQESARIDEQVPFKNVMISVFAAAAKWPISYCDKQHSFSRSTRWMSEPSAKPAEFLIFYHGLSRPELFRLLSKDFYSTAWEFKTSLEWLSIIPFHWDLGAGFFFLNI